jgi:hypothetical protein
MIIHDDGTIEVDVDKAQTGSLYLCFFSTILIAGIMLAFSSFSWVILAIPAAIHVGVFMICPLVFGIYIVMCQILAETITKDKNST